MTDRHNIMFELMRVLMSFFVIYTHSIQEIGVLVNPILGKRIMFNSVIYNLTFIAVPIYLMISGALLLNREDNRKK